MPATVLAYFQLGQFLMLVMFFSWLYSTFGFLSICIVIGPKDNFGQLSITHLFRKCSLCRVSPENSKRPAANNENVNLALEENAVTDLPPGQKPDITTHL